MMQIFSSGLFSSENEFFIVTFWTKEALEAKCQLTLQLTLINYYNLDVLRNPGY